LEKSAVILAGGFSRRFGQDKGLLPLANKPLIEHVLDAIDKIVDEKIVVVSSKTQAENYTKVLDSKVKVVVDDDNVQSPLVGALKGFKEASNEYALLLPCDTPLLSKDVLSLLLDLCPNKNAVIPRWPNGYIEPLQAVYCTKPALEAAKKALSEGKMNMQSMVDKLRGVRYVSTLVLRQLDPELKSFFNVNTPMDLRKAEAMLRENKNKV
jgi:molybdopterin-guanine dinucleotide biosynthesis protein A